jgi:WD40 repeat protein
MGFSRDGQRLVSAGDEATARLWDVSTGESLFVLSGHAERIVHAEISPDGQKVATASEDNTARLWELQGGQHFLRLGGHTGVVFQAAYSPDGRYAATGSLDLTVRVFDAATGSPLATLVHPQPAPMFDFSPDGSYLATGSNIADPVVRVWDWRAGRIVQTLKGHKFGVTYVTFSSDGQRLASTGPDGMRLWNWRTGETLWALDKPAIELVWPRFSPDGQRLAITNVAGDVHVFDIKTRRILFSSTDNRGRGSSAAYSPDGKWLLTSGRKTRILDADTGHPLLEYVGHLDATVGAEFSRDGRRIVTMGTDRTVRVFDAATGQPLHILRTDIGYSAVFSPDGQHILVAHPGDHSAKIYPATTQALLHMACELLRYQPEWPEVKGTCAAVP